MIIYVFTKTYILCTSGRLEVSKQRFIFKRRVECNFKIIIPIYIFFCLQIHAFPSVNNMLLLGLIGTQSRVATNLETEIKKELIVAA
jgi:hypothetical protein